MLQELTSAFNTTNALSNMFLWLLFSELSKLLNCDLQRILRGSSLALHLTGLLTFFFLFTLIDTTNQASLGATWLKTVVVYGLFILTTKAKWYFVVPVLVLLLIDQSVKKHYQHVKMNQEGQVLRVDQEALRHSITRNITFVIIALAVVGTLQYAYLQHIEYGPGFSVTKLLFGATPCKTEMPQYDTMTRKR